MCIYVIQKRLTFLTIVLANFRLKKRRKIEIKCYNNKLERLIHKDIHNGRIMWDVRKQSNR